MERRLGQVSQVVTSGSESHIKLSWDTVYDIPLLGSLKQQLADEHYSGWGRILCATALSHGVSKDAAHFNLFCIVPLYMTLCSHEFHFMDEPYTSKKFIYPFKNIKGRRGCGISRRCKIYASKYACSLIGFCMFMCVLTGFTRTHKAR